MERKHSLSRSLFVPFLKFPLFAAIYKESSRKLIHSVPRVHFALLDSQFGEVSLRSLETGRRENWKRDSIRSIHIILISLLIILSFQVRYLEKNLASTMAYHRGGSWTHQLSSPLQRCISRARSARRLPLGLRKYWHRRSVQVHTREALPSGRLSSTTDARSIRVASPLDINVGKHCSHSRMPSRIDVVAPGCVYKKIE